MATTKARTRRSTPDKAQEATTTPKTSKKPAEGAQEQKEAVLPLDLSECHPVPKPDPNAIMFDEYGIDGQCANIPNILKAILCEMIRGRKNG